MKKKPTQDSALKGKSQAHLAEPETSIWNIPSLVPYFLALFFGSLVFFLINIQFPVGHNFDEFHYVPAAKLFLNFEMNHNIEHPPLPKIMMAFGIGLFGDHPIGWRIMSVLFGSLTLAGVFAAALALFRKRSVALWVALLTLVNQLLYVQSRIGMLDTFMMAFMIWAFAFYFELWYSPSKKALTWSGALFGLAMACKWFALMPWLAAGALYALVLMFQSWGTEFKNPKDSDWFSDKLFVELKPLDWVLRFFGVGVFIYFLTFTPYLLMHREPAYTLIDLFKIQWEMYDAQLRVVNSHPYMSEWKSWAMMTRPIWYAFDHEAEGAVRGVILLGNPLLMWGGLLTLAACFFSWVKDRTKISFLIVATYTALYLTWAFIPRKVAFYYYYYPAGTLLSFSWAYVMERYFPEGSKTKWVRWVVLGSAAAVFVYFFPILAALKINGDSFRKWMWLSTWI